MFSRLLLCFEPLGVYLHVGEVGGALKGCFFIVIRFFFFCCWISDVKSLQANTPFSSFRILFTLVSIAPKSQTADCIYTLMGFCVWSWSVVFLLSNTTPGEHSFYNMRPFWQFLYCLGSDYFVCGRPDNVTYELNQPNGGVWPINLKNHKSCCENSAFP